MAAVNSSQHLSKRKSSAGVSAALGFLSQQDLHKSFTNIYTATTGPDAEQFKTVWGGVDPDEFDHSSDSSSGDDEGQQGARQYKSMPVDSNMDNTDVPVLDRMPRSSSTPAEMTRSLSQRLSATMLSIRSLMSPRHSVSRLSPPRSPLRSAASATDKGNDVSPSTQPQANGSPLLLRSATVATTSHASETKFIEQTSTKSARSKALWDKAKWHAMQEVAAKKQRERDATAKSFSAESTLSDYKIRRGHRTSLTFTDVVVDALEKSRQEKQAQLDKQPKVAARKRVRALIESNPAHAVMMVLTIYSLYAVDIAILCTADTRGDDALYALNVACFALFALEWGLRMAVLEEYLFSFFWWLDLIATASFLPDIIYVASGRDVVAQMGALVLARGGRAARFAGKLAKVARMVALLTRIKFRHIRDEKVRRRRGGGGRGGELPASPSRADQAEVSREESRHGEEDGTEGDLGSRLDHEVTMHTLTVLGLMLLLVVGIEALRSCVRPHSIITALAASWLHLMPEQDKPFSSDFQVVFDATLQAMEDLDAPVIYLNFNDQELFGEATSIDSVRQYPIEFEEYTFTRQIGAQKVVGLVHFSIRESVRQDAMVFIIYMTVVLVIFLFATIRMSAFIRREVVEPIEHLMHTLEKFAANPIKPLKEREVDDKQKEMTAVENTVVRFGSLLRVTLGEAGTNIISRNLRNGRLEVTDRGRFVHALFGFCDIRNFTDLTEVLKREVVQVVNAFAEIVHTAVTENYGAPNKNIGDAFLLVWKPKQKLSITQVADAALRSYVKIVLEIAHSKQLASWADRNEIRRGMGSSFKMGMGFGLHQGWAIECAVGSELKIDATYLPSRVAQRARRRPWYLSPHVNMASRLESATKQYGVKILISGPTFEMFSQEVQSLCRIVDRVTVAPCPRSRRVALPGAFFAVTAVGVAQVKGSEVPIILYTYDVPLGSESLDNGGGVLGEIQSAAVNGDSSSMRADFPSTRTKHNRTPPIQFFTNVAPPCITNSFRMCHVQAMSFYLGTGNNCPTDWVRAAQLFKQCLSMKADDGPCTAILKYIEENAVDGNAPSDWRGYRPLVDK